MPCAIDVVYHSSIKVVWLYGCAKCWCFNGCNNASI